MKQDKYYIEYNDQEQSFDVYEVIAWHDNGSKQTAQTFCRCFDESDANQIIKTLNLTKDLPSKEKELEERIQQLEESLKDLMNANPNDSTWNYQAAYAKASKLLNNK